MVNLCGLCAFSVLSKQDAMLTLEPSLQFSDSRR
jgi:hypothetical protein